MFRCLLILLTAISVRAEIRLPGCTAYGSPDFDALRVSKERGVQIPAGSKQAVLWFGDLKKTGRLEVSAVVNTASMDMKLTVGAETETVSTVIDLRRHRPLRRAEGRWHACNVGTK